MFGSICFADTDFGPVVAGIGGGDAIDVENPLVIRGPTRSEEEMSGCGFDELAVFSVQVACPDLISLWRCEVIGDAFSIVAEAESVGEAIAGFGKIAGVGPVEIHADDATDTVFNDLHKNALVADEEGWGFKGGDAVFGAEFLKSSRLKIVNPSVCRGLRVVDIEGFSGAVPARFHTEKDDSVPV